MKKKNCLLKVSEIYIFFLRMFNELFSIANTKTRKP